MDTHGVTERAELLSRVWLFSECTDDELTHIAALAHDEHIPADTVVVREGDPGDEFYVIVDGVAVVTLGGDHLNDLGPSSFFGEMALLDGGERLATVTSTTEMHLLALHREDFNQMLALAMPAIAPKLLTVVGRRARAIDVHEGRGLPFGV